MQARTAFRLAMLKNGFQPLLNDCKRPIEKGWPRHAVDEMKRDRVLGKMSAQEAFRRHLEQI